MPHFFSPLISSMVELAYFNTAPVAPVSVVIPCNRDGVEVARAVSSVAKQSVQPKELIMVNDGGGEELGKLLVALQNQYGSDWFSIISLSKNVGAGEARNAGWATAKGSYVAFLDSDDAWHPRKVEIQYEFMASRPEVAVCGHRHREESGEAHWVEYEVTGRWSDVRLSKLLLSNQFITPSAMVRRDLDVRFPCRQRHMEDFSLWLTIALRGGQIVRLEDELGCIYKPPFLESGLSAELLRMEIGEIRAYTGICMERALFWPAMLFFLPYSMGKFLRRLFLVFLKNGRTIR
jgi:glycosyltransferase involved in cell wall biosynthesis